MIQKKIPVILDGDPGHDDAIAWVLAKSSPLLDIRACTSVCGNQTIEKTTYNALRICTLIGNHAPFGVGRPRPLVAEPIVVPTVHGKSGLDGPDLPEPDFEPCGLSAPALMEKVIEESEGPVTIVPTGPLTNVAALLLTRPDLKPKIARISLMGGGIAYGNWTPAAEFNILVDPEAAKVVFESGIPIIMAVIGAVVAFVATNEDARKAIVRAFNAIRSGIVNALGAVKRTVQSVMSFVQTTFTSAMDAAKKAVSDGIKTVSETFTNLKTTVTNALSGASTWLVSAGEDIINGSEQEYVDFEEVKDDKNGQQKQQ